MSDVISYAKNGIIGKQLTRKNGPVTTSEIVYQDPQFNGSGYWYSSFIVDTNKTDEGFPMVFTISKRPIHPVQTPTGIEFVYGEENLSIYVSKIHSEFPMELVRTPHERMIYNAATAHV